MAKQLITPNLDPYIFINGKPLTDWLGWCMGYVYSAFANVQRNGTHKATVGTAPSAHEGWVKSQRKHKNKSFPSGVYFPIWFDWFGDIDGTGVKNWGHVAIMKDGKVWSSPITHKPYADEYPSLAACIQAFGGSIKYVGWSEDLCGTPVISLPAAVPMATKAQVTKLYQDLLGRAPDAGGLSHYVGHYTYTFVEQDIKNSAEYKKRQAALAKAKDTPPTPKPTPSPAPTPTPKPTPTPVVTPPATQQGSGTKSEQSPPAPTQNTQPTKPKDSQKTTSHTSPSWWVRAWNWVLRFLDIKV